MNWYKRYQMRLGRKIRYDGLPTMSSRDVEDFMNFLGYVYDGCRGDHHKFTKPGKPSVDIGYTLGTNDITKNRTGNTGFGFQLKNRIGWSVPMFNEYWMNRKVLLKITDPIERQRAIRVIQYGEDEGDAVIDSGSEKVITFDAGKIDYMARKMPNIRGYIESLIQGGMTVEEARENVFEQFILPSDGLKDIFLKI